MKVLLTGFDPFGSDVINPAIEAVKLVNVSNEDIEVIKLEVPTVFYKSIEVVEKKILEVNPDVVLSIGQAGGRKELSIERVAINLNDARIKDNEGNQPLDTCIFEDGENAYFTSLPIKQMLKALKDNDISSTISYSAGTFVCNHLMYGVLYLTKKKYPHIKAGFIHVPYIPSQVVGKNQPSMPLETIAKGVEIAIQVIASESQDCDLLIGSLH